MKTFKTFRQYLLENDDRTFSKFTAKMHGQEHDETKHGLKKAFERTHRQFKRNYEDKFTGGMHDKIHDDGKHIIYRHAASDRGLSLYNSKHPDGHGDVELSDISGGHFTKEGRHRAIDHQNPHLSHESRAVLKAAIDKDEDS